MKEMRVYIKKRNGEAAGMWFVLPVNEEDLREQLEMENSLEEIEIWDNSELPFSFSETATLDEVNHLYDLVCELADTPIEPEIRTIQSVWFTSLEELVSQKDHIRSYPGCETMEDVASYRYENMSDDVPESVPKDGSGHIDCKAYGDYLDHTGRYLSTNHGIYSYEG